MATTYDKASLVMIPSGVKEDKLYSIKPTDGSGDFTFSRNSDIQATRVNSSGLIEKAKENKVLYSQDFSNAAWSAAAGTTLTHGQTDPNGGTTATKIDFSASGQAFEQEISGFSTSNVYAFSIYVRCDSGTIDFEMGNLNALAFETRTATTEWQRFTIYQQPSATTRYPRFVQSKSASTLYIAFAQLNHGLVAQDYVETTTTAVVEGLTADLPRLDYSGGASCPSLLLEPSRTNLFTQSEYFGADWSVSNATLTTNSVTSPEGVQNATTFTTSVFGADLRESTNVTGTYTFSVFAKLGDVGGIRLRIDAADDANAFFDLTDGTLDSKSGTNAVADLVDYGNGWYRCYLTADVVNTQKLQIFTTDGTTSYANGSVYLYGAQVEEGSYPTSYIPTYGTAAVRASEPNGIGKTDLITDGFFSSTELTWFIDIDLFQKDSGSSVAPRLVNSSNGNIFIGLNETLGGNLNIRHKDGTTAANTSGVSFDENGQRFKVLVKISGTNGEAFINGSSVGTFTTLAVSNYDEFENVAANAYDLRQMLMFPTALTDAEAIALTTI